MCETHILPASPHREHGLAVATNKSIQNPEGQKCKKPHWKHTETSRLLGFLQPAVWWLVETVWPGTGSIID